MTEAQFKKLKIGDVVISKVVPTNKYVVTKKHKDYYTITHSITMATPVAWALVKGKK